uniref:Isochorismatase-like domain-containing protein n=1 Tax=Phenylobacterium glaciei TaxID=2803784 RepID=A0A974P1D3_9CAUL|nr:hypothetical protein JKL49_18755 [Phenylobacterium glaciei]
MSGYAPNAAALVCLDLQRGRLSTEGAAATAAVCRKALAQARRRRWPVLHVYARQGAMPPDRPIPGLEPCPARRCSCAPVPQPSPTPASAKRPRVSADRWC